MTTGRNTVSGDQLTGYIDRIERLREQKAALGEDEKAVFAEAKAAGFNPQRIRECLKIRAQKPHDRQEAQQELDMYLHALGMDAEAPLFRAVGMMGVDTAVREQVIEALKELVPQSGEIIVKAGGNHVRLWRDKAGEARAEDYVEPTPPAPAPSGGLTGMPEREVPLVDDKGAEALGAAAYRDNKPITANPFPFGDARRACFDRGYRSASGSDGMGPPDPDDSDE